MMKKGKILSYAYKLVGSIISCGILWTEESNKSNWLTEKKKNEDGKKIMFFHTPKHEMNI